MAAIKMIRDIIGETIEECTNTAKEKFRNAILPVYGSDEKGRPSHIGSCVLIKLGNIPFLITAAHIVDEADKTTLYLGKEALVPLTGEFHVTNPNKPTGTRDDDQYDFAFIQVSDELKASLGEVDYLTEKDLCLETPSTEGHAYTAFGYPNSRNNKVDYISKHIKSTMWPYTATIVKDISALAKQFGINDKDHICINFDLKRARNPEGNIVTPPKPTGMSGGALIDLGKLTDVEKLAKPAEFEARLIGLLIEHRSEHKAMVATRIRTIVDAINTVFGKP